MNFLSLLEAKRDGAALSPDQIQGIVGAVVARQIPDYQLSSFLMAVFFRGLDAAETRALTLAMRDSGEALSFPDDGRPVVDKHSTGGVGDKVSLPLAPLLACLGLRVPMISGRGLGITGGTLDKLESIPGFSTRHSPARILELTQRVGCCMAGQTETMVPADRILYALRDASATVPSIPLITASILSKKLAEGLDALILDVKWGRAAFMLSQDEARTLGRAMVRLGTDCGTPTRAFLSDMNLPLGQSAGNWLEVVESVQVLEGRGPADTRQIVLECAARLLQMTGRAPDAQSGREQAARCLESGAPREKWNELLVAQGADLRAFEAKLRAPAPLYETAIPARESGFVTDLDARTVGEVVRDLGGGRAHQDAVLNLEVGLHAMKKPGERVENGEPLALLRAADENAAQAAIERLRVAWRLGSAAPAPIALIEEIE